MDHHNSNTIPPIQMFNILDLDSGITNLPLNTMVNDMCDCRTNSEIAFKHNGLFSWLRIRSSPQLSSVSNNSNYLLFLAEMAHFGRVSPLLFLVL